MHNMTCPITEAKHLLSSLNSPFPALSPLPFFQLQSHKWCEGSTAGLPSGVLLNTRHSPALKCQPLKFSCYAPDSGVNDHEIMDKRQLQSGPCPYGADCLLRIIVNIHSRKASIASQATCKQSITGFSHGFSACFSLRLFLSQWWQ